MTTGVSIYGVPVSHPGRNIEAVLDFLVLIAIAQSTNFCNSTCSCAGPPSLPPIKVGAEAIIVSHNGSAQHHLCQKVPPKLVGGPTVVLSCC